MSFDCDSARPDGTAAEVAKQLESSVALTDPLGAAGTKTSAKSQDEAGNTNIGSLTPAKKGSRSKEKANKPVKPSQQPGGTTCRHFRVLLTLL